MAEAGSSNGSDAAGQRFLDYLSAHRLPVCDAEIHSDVEPWLNLALIEHAPNSGRWFDPVDDLVIGVTRRGSGARITRDAGRGKVEFACLSGGIIATPPGRSSFWRFDGSPEVLYLSVSATALPILIGGDGDQDRFLAGLGRYPVFDSAIGVLANRLWKVKSGVDNQFPSSLAQNGIGTILALLQGASCAQADLGTRKTSALSQTKLRKVQALMAQPGARVTVSDLAREVSMSPDHFMRAFKVATGQSPYRMASEIRVGEAKRLLAETRLPLTQIALELGFSSSAHFSNRFAELTGVAPSLWRKTNQP